MIDHNTYDAQGRLVERAYADTKDTYAYDAKGRVVEYVRGSVGEDPFERTRFEYCD